MRIEVREKNSALKQLSSGIGVGSSAPTSWQPLHTQPLLIIVGLTGVGKSTVISNLTEESLDFTLLPNRRNLTDEVIIPTVAQNNQYSLNCRVQRFNYTRQYRQKFSGGMAHVLSQVWINPQQVKPQLIFDGLRGKNEVSYAATIFPNAKFIVLEAPNKVRLQRILKRNDVFDAVKGFSSDPQSISSSQITTFADLALPEATSVFNPTEEQEILSWVREGIVTLEELKEKLKIVVKEQQNYDSLSTRLTLEEMVSERTLVIETTTCNPQQAASRILSELNVNRAVKCLSIS